MCLSSPFIQCAKRQSLYLESKAKLTHNLTPLIPRTALKSQFMSSSESLIFRLVVYDQIFEWMIFSVLDDWDHWNEWYIHPWVLHTGLL